MKRILSLLALLALALPAAAQKISDLTALGAAPATGDKLIVLDVSDTTMAGTGTTKSMTVANLFSAPAFGVATATSLNGLTITTTTGTLTMTNGKTLSVTNTLTLAGTDGSTLNIGAGGTLGTAAFTSTAAYQVADADLTTYAGITPSANVQTLLGSANNATFRTNLGASTVGSAIFTLTNPSAVTFIRMNADNTATARTAPELLADLAVPITFGDGTTNTGAGGNGGGVAVVGGNGGATMVFAGGDAGFLTMSGGNSDDAAAGGNAGSINTSGSGIFAGGSLTLNSNGTNAAGSINTQAGGSLTMGAGTLTGPASTGTIALTSQIPTRTSLGLPGSMETRATDFVTTVASASAFEQIFTAVACTSGKTYTFEVEVWLKWATAATSGPAVLASSIADPGTLTMGQNRMIAYVDVTAVGGAADTVDSTNGTVSESTSWRRYRATGFFTASSSANFNWGINVSGWDSGDVVTIAKGAKLSVQQVD